MTDLSIIVMAYERSDSLRRLLNSLNHSTYPTTEINLILTIGNKIDNQDVLSIANEFNWLHGKKTVHYLEETMSITEHYHYVLRLGLDLDNIIILEDDLYVSPVFYYFAGQALESVIKSSNIAGISLNRVWFNGYTQYPFLTIKDSGDNYYMQIPFYQGQAFSKDMIERYLKWLEISNHNVSDDDLLHEKLISLASQDDEWFPKMTKYLVDTNQYFLYPYTSLTTNFGDRGKHFSKSTDYFQTQLELSKIDFTMIHFEDSIAIYDSFHELLPQCLTKLMKFNKFDIPDNEYDLDLQGTKSERVLMKKYVLTIREGKSPLISFDVVMKPLVQNIISNIPGLILSLYRREDISFTKASDQKIDEFRYRYFNLKAYELSTLRFIIMKIKKLFHFH